MRAAFTLIELLIVIALLAAVSMIVLPHFAGNKKEMTDTVIQSEMAEIQRAFFRFRNDCILRTQKDYQNVAQYGVSVLLRNYELKDGNENTLFDNWDNDKNCGWRGAYLHSEGMRVIDPNTKGQQCNVNGNTMIPVICSPDADAELATDPNFYRIIASAQNNHTVLPLSSDPPIYQLWLVYPYFGNNIPETIPAPNDANRKYYRKLLVEVEDAE
jgi:prepilin-type N-terminal cleavage/methylation domain-containing protein